MGDFNGCNHMGLLGDAYVAVPSWLVSSQFCYHVSISFKHDLGKLLVSVYGTASHLIGFQSQYYLGDAAFHF